MPTLSLDDGITIDIRLVESQATIITPTNLPNFSVTVPGPQGPKGDTGNTGPQGLPGDLTPATATAVTTAQSVTSEMLPSTRQWTLGANITLSITGTFPADKAGTITLILKQAASGGPWNVTFPTTIEWPNDSAGPSVPTTANSELMVHLFWTGLSWRGMVGGLFFP